MGFGKMKILGAISCLKIHWDVIVSRVSWKVGSSLLLLLFIAMPLAYMVAIVYTMIAVKWPFKFTVGAVLSAFIPFRNSILDRRLKSLENPSETPL